MSKIGLSLIIVGIFVLFIPSMVQLLPASIEYFKLDSTTVDPDSTIVISYSYRDVWSNEASYACWDNYYEVFIYDGNGNTIKHIPKHHLNSLEIREGSVTFNAPSVAGSYTAKMVVNAWLTNPCSAGSTRTKTYTSSVTYTVRETTITKPSYTLTINSLDGGNNILPFVDIALNTGPIGTTDSNGILIIPNVNSTQNIVATKSGYESCSISVEMTEDKTISVILNQDTTICYTLYDPVCGVDGVTYSNDCVARVAGVEIDYYGECIISDVPPDFCNMYWWYDDNHQYCQESKFCGAFMYESLKTFVTKEDCEASLNGSIVPTVTPTGTVQPPKFAIVTITLTSNDKSLLPDQEIIINNKEYITNNTGVVSITSDIGETIEVIITIEGYNTFKKSYTITEDTEINVQLQESGGDYFFNLDPIKNTFYDPEMPFGIPMFIFIISGICIVLGIINISSKGGHKV